jgi:hypothetical protein
VIATTSAIRTFQLHGLNGSDDGRSLDPVSVAIRLLVHPAWRSRTTLHASFVPRLARGFSLIGCLHHSYAMTHTGVELEKFRTNNVFDLSRLLEPRQVVYGYACRRVAKNADPVHLRGHSE